jgi:formylglycine-generating enzyme required for sulfatase activity
LAVAPTGRILLVKLCFGPTNGAFHAAIIARYAVKRPFVLGFAMSVDTQHKSFTGRITSAVTLVFFIACVSLSMTGCQKREDTPQYTPPAAMPAETIQALSAAATKRTFRDCENCPQMVVIPAGEFVMGSPPGEVAFVANQGPPIKNAPNLHEFLKFTAEREEPQHRVVIAKPFAVSEFVITSRQYDEFFREWKKNQPSLTVWLPVLSDA